MTSYHIIDEPKPKFSEKLVVNPVIILFAAILVPLFWNIPLAGKLWIPLVWVIANGIILGSSTLGKEILTIFLGSLFYLIVLFGTFFVITSTDYLQYQEVVKPYLHIFLQAIFFVTLYISIFMQTASYNIFDYIRENR